MFDHVGLWVSDRAASERFYRTVLGALGVEQPPVEPASPYVEWNDLAIGHAPDRPVTTGVHLGLVAPSVEAIHAFWQAGVDAGFASDGEPGPRPVYGDDYVGAFLLDPDGNSIEAMRHEHMRTDGGLIDHVTVGVDDLAGVTAFYDLVAPHAGYARRHADDTLTRWRNTRGEGRDGGSFTMIADGRPPARNVHMAIGVADHATVDAFHAAAVAAGYPDHGAPGERPVYHPGYYAAYVLDPSGHNIELVDHGGHPGT
ncbi:MAG: VOC family protein [Solirubrobacteraceae bacterium]|nr:VOC family protein [Patulibacter sp.]